MEIFKKPIEEKDIMASKVKNNSEMRELECLISLII